ncbi:MAG: hypothetical protein JW725_02055 [Candidatus Babeliaceae bacterium]|nr:hypothetical protein [Candidatus Babeliaceae bacterium]
MCLYRRFFLILAMVFFATLELDGRALVTIEEVKGDQIGYIVHSLYGDFFVNEPVLCAILRSSAFSRLEDVRQYGVCHYCAGPHYYTRHGHSLGVFSLVRLFGGSLAQQISGLTHDFSHTPFSHSTGYGLAKDVSRADYLQDDIHRQYLKDSGVAYLLANFEYSLFDIDLHRTDFMIVKRSPPDLCADNIDYILQGAVYDGVLSYNDVKRIFFNLKHNGTDWYFDDESSANSFARAALKMMLEIWSSPGTQMRDRLFGEILRRAFKIGLLTRDMIVFGTDDAIWGILQASSDPEIVGNMYTILHWRDLFVINEAGTHGAVGMFVQPGKFRGIDPLVLQSDGSLERLSKIDQEFAAEFEQARITFKKGWLVEIRKLPFSFKKAKQE